jgi:hypothetical protein
MPKINKKREENTGNKEKEEKEKISKKSTRIYPSFYPFVYVWHHCSWDVVFVA